MTIIPIHPKKSGDNIRLSPLFCVVLRPIPNRKTKQLNSLIMNTLHKSLFYIIALMAFGQTAWAQTSSSNLPAEVRAEDATITKLGHATMTVEMKIVTDSLTRRTDTLRSVTDIEWDTPAGTAKRRNAELSRNNPNGSGFYDEGHSS